MLSWREITNETARALAFLSRLPIPDRYFVGYDGRLCRTVAAFPLAGLLLSLPAAGLLYVLLEVHTSGILAAFMAVTLQIVLTGGLHEDGLSDTADGLGGGRDREKALEIMKDSRIGSYGGLAMILSVGLRVSALAGLAEGLSPLAAASLFVAAAVASRALLVWHWFTLPPARPGGVTSTVGVPDEDAMRFALAVGTALVVLLVIPVTSILATFASLLTAAFATAAFTAHVRRRLAGHTGDTIGAAQQIAEITFLVALAITI